MLVENIELYHVQKINHFTKEWEVGHKIYFNETVLNNFFSSYKNIEHFISDKSGNTYYLRIALQKYFEKNWFYKIFNFKRLIKELSDAITDQCAFIREIIFEEVRKQFFNELPSRMNCIFVCNKNEVELWWQRLNNGNTKIFKVKLNGNILIANEKYLIAETMNYEKYKNNAIEYWKGSETNNQLNQEMLFVGEVEILAEFENLDIFRTSHST